MQLIWLDNSPCSAHIQSKLFELNPTIQFYTDLNRCITSIKSIKDEQILLIVSLALTKNILCQIHSHHLLMSVFIFCSNINENQKLELMNEYKKINQIYSDNELLIKSIQQTINVIEQQILSFNVFNQNKDYTNDLSKSSASFIWYQILLDILKQIPDNEQINKKIYENYNELYKSEINQLKKDYTKEKVIQLFNEKTSIHKILNKTLRTKNIEFIYLFQYFIIDLYDHIQYEKESCENSEILKVYYGKRMLNIELDQLKKHIGYYITPNGFLSVSFDKNKSVELAKTEILSDGYQSTLFQFEINPKCQQITFVEIHDKQELLFNIDTIFKIHSINFDSSIQLWQINLINDDIGKNKIQTYFQSIKKFRYENSFLIFFGHLLNELDQLQQSELYFHILLESLSSNHEDIASIYNQIGNFIADKGQLKLALENYQRGYEIRCQRLPNDHPHISISLNNIGLIYKDEGKLDDALSYCQKALTIDEINYPKDHVLKAMTIENIGGIYKEKYLFSIAQTYFLRALNMYKSALPPNHHFLTDILNSLGKVYCDQGYYDRALTCYQKAFATSEINYTNDHLQKAQTIENIGLLYKTNGMLQKALEELLRALDMYQRIYFNEHHDIARCFGHIGLVYEASNDLDFALNYFNKQLNMDEKCLSNDHPNIQIDIQWIIDIYKKQEQFKKAFEFCQKKFLEKKNLLGENHPMTLTIFMMMIDLCEDFNVKSNYYKHALSMHESLIPFDPHATIRCLDTMINFYYKTNAVEEALNYQIKMVDLERQVLTDDHINLALSLQRLGQIYETLSKTDEAKICYTESRTMFEKYEHNQSNSESSDKKNSSESNTYQEKKELNFTKSRICVLQ
ncbi:unnamed protein product [Rotaria magnacalcarata]|uniref:Uncharacterized protein n=1 Tax=Rotaria magnacalcarata TaxID=392030 RepID=A0A820BMA6_9BILA|nr:unnamed protein product [Rotaria magnacalcarata]CAF4195061.1 unnamed protein product [Rotaria magnacalcarata]